MNFKDIQNIQHLLKETKLKIAEGIIIDPSDEEENIYEIREQLKEVYEQPSRMEEEIREQERLQREKEKPNEIVEMSTTEVVKPQEIITSINTLRDAYTKVYKYLLAKKDLFGKAETAIKAAAIIEKVSAIILSKIENLLISIYNFETTDNIKNLMERKFPQEYANVLIEQFDTLREILSSKAEGFKYYILAPSEDIETLKEFLNDIKELNEAYRIFKESLSSAIKPFQQGVA